MQELERIPEALTIEELLGLAAGDDASARPTREDRAPRPTAAVERAEQDPADVLLSLFGGQGAAEPEAESPARGASVSLQEPTTPAATLASLFGVDEQPPVAAPASQAAESPREFDLFAAFGGAPEATPAVPEERPARDPEPEKPFDLLGALGLDAAAAAKPAAGPAPADAAPLPPREEARPLRGRYADLQASRPAAAPKPAPAKAPAQRPVPKAAAAQPPVVKAASEPAPTPAPKPPERPGEPTSASERPQSAPAKEKPQVVAADGDAPKPASASRADSQVTAPQKPVEQKAVVAPKPEKSKPVVAQSVSPKPVAAQTSAQGSDRAGTSRARAAFDARVARKCLPAAAVKAAAAQQAASPASGSQPKTGQPSAVAAVVGSSQPAASTAPARAAAAAVAAPAVKPVGTAAPAREASKSAAPPARDTGERARRLTFAGVALVAVAALAGSMALAVALDGGEAAARGESTPLALLAGGPQQGASTEEYRYKVKGSGEGMGQAVEKADFNDDGHLVRSTITVQFADEEQARVFLDEARAAFGDSLVSGEVAGASASFTVSAEGDPVDRATYVELLRRDTVDFQEVSG